MTLERNDKINLIKYRIEKADDIFEEAEILFEKDKLLGTANRIYYSLFNLINALALKDAVNIKKHTTLKAFFNKNYLKNDIIDKNIGKVFNEAMMYRSDGDYKINLSFNKDDIQKLLKKAYLLSNIVKDILHK